jgi:hypothetical protein
MSAKQPALRRRVERVRVKTQVAEMIGEFGWTVRAEHLSRFNPAHGFYELIVIGVI